MHKNHQRGDKSKSIIARAPIFVCDNRHDLFYITVKYHKNITNGFQVIERTQNVYGRTGVRTDGRQAHHYIPRTFRSGIKRDCSSFKDIFLVLWVPKSSYAIKSSETDISSKDGWMDDAILRPFQ